MCKMGYVLDLREKTMSFIQTRRDFLKAMALFVAAQGLSCTHKPKTRKPPNFVVVFLDDSGYVLLHALLSLQGAIPAIQKYSELLDRVPEAFLRNFLP